jgi:hypothetical protein
VLVDRGGHDTGCNDTGGHDTGGHDTGGHDTGGHDTGGHDTSGLPLSTRTVVDIGGHGHGVAVTVLISDSCGVLAGLPAVSARPEFSRIPNRVSAA